MHDNYGHLHMYDYLLGNARYLAYAWPPSTGVLDASLYPSDAIGELTGACAAYLGNNGSFNGS